MKVRFTPYDIIKPGRSQARKIVKCRIRTSAHAHGSNTLTVHGKSSDHLCARAVAGSTRHLQHAGTCEVQREMHQVANSGQRTTNLTTILKVGISKKKK